MATSPTGAPDLAGAPARPADGSAVPGAMQAAAMPPSVGGAGPRASVLRRLFRRRAAAFGVAVVAFFVTVALSAPLVAPQDPLATNFSAVRNAPSAGHWFGTDEIGRDVASRVAFGARASLLAGVVSVVISLSFGVPIGLLAGYAGGKTDGLISRLTDAMLVQGAGDDAWAMVNDAALDGIAAKCADDLAAYLSNTPEAAPAAALSYAQ